MTAARVLVSVNRADLDETDITAERCDGCGKWTVGKFVVHAGEESAVYCPRCCKVML